MENLPMLVAFLAVAMGGALAAFRAGLPWMFAYATLANAISVSFGLATVTGPLGQVVMIAALLYSVNFYLTDLMEEYFGKGSARKLIVIIVGTQLGMIGAGSMILGMSPASTDAMFPIVEGVIQPWMAMIVVTMIGGVILQLIDTQLYQWIRDKTGEKWLWLRNNGSTITTMTIDSFFVLPTAIYFAFPEMPPAAIWSLSISSLALKIIIALFDTPFMYLSKKLRPRELRDRDGA